MKLTKMLTAVAVTSTVIAAMAMSASAALEASYTPAADEAPAVITLANVPTRTGADDATLLVLNTDVFADFDKDSSATVNITPAVIENINQSANTTDFARIPINALDEGETVYVRMQVDGKIYTAEYTLPKTTPDEPEYTYGDVDNNGLINATDASWVLTKYGIPTTVFPCGEDDAGDVDANGLINATDASWILTKYGIPTTVFPAELK